MVRNYLALLPLFLLISGCAAVTHFSNPNASGYRKLEHEECVPYARRVSGIQLRGDAYTWWNKAAGIYARGQTPLPGAILVLSQTNKLRRGHLAVVTNILAPREINVTHTNWGNDWMSRRVTYETLRVQDVSPANNWSSVRFWNNEENVFGFPYPAQGFIYNRKE